MIVNQHHYNYAMSKEKQDIFEEESILRAPNSFYLFKAKRQNEVHGQSISYQQLMEEWNTMSKDQRAEFENQSECLQFTMNIDENNKKKSTHFIPKILLPPTTTTSSMVIPNDHSVDNSPTNSKEDDYFLYQHPLYNTYPYPSSASSSASSPPQQPPDATNKLIPNLSYSAAAEAAALESFNTEKQNKITTSQSTKRKYGIIPEKVKRPPNAYLLFNRDMRRQLHDVHLGLTSGEISKSISQKWKQLPQEQKDYYFKEESKLKQKHNNEHVNFIYTRRSKAEMKQADSLKQQFKPKKNPCPAKPSSPPPKRKLSQPSDGKDPRGRKKKRADESLPKHPMSGYLHFAKKMRPIMKRERPEARLVDISREIGLRWRSLTPEEMQPWIDMSNQDKARYAKEMKDRIQEDAQSFSSHSSTCSKRKFSSISSNTSVVVLEELDSETIATVAQMVNFK